MPEVTIQPCQKDNWIDEADFANKNGTDALLTLGRQSSPAYMRDIIMQFDLSSIPPGSQIASAVLWLYQTSAPSSAPACISRILSGNADWSENNSDWDDWDDPTGWAGSDGLETLGVDIASAQMWLGTPTAGAGWREFNLDPTEFQALLDVYNYGFKLWLTDRTSVLVPRTIVYASKEHGTAAWRPKLIVTYNLPSIRLTKYYVDVWDKEFKIFDSQGRQVAPDEIDENNWIRLIGAGRPGSKVYDTLIEDPLVSFIENVSFRMQDNKAKIRGSKESMLTAFLKRLGGVSS